MVFDLYTYPGLPGCRLGACPWSKRPRQLVTALSPAINYNLVSRLKGGVRIQIRWQSVGIGGYLARSRDKYLGSL